MVISTHLSPPVMIDKTADRAAITHALCCSCAMCFSAAASSEKVQGRVNLASNTAPLPSTLPSRVSESFLRMVDDWRRGQIDVPSRAEAIRRMVELAINAKKKPDIDR